MLKKCDANCDASVAHLWLRIFLFLIYYLKLASFVLTYLFYRV